MTRRSTEPQILFTAQQLAARWQVPVSTVYAWARRNEIPHYRAGRLLRFDPTEVAEQFRPSPSPQALNPDEVHPGEAAFGLLTA